MLSIFCIAITCTSDAAPTSTTAKLNCLIRKLKAEHKLADDYPEFAVPKDESDCDQFIIDADKEAYTAIAFDIRIHSFYGDHTSCIMARLRSLKLVEDIWLNFIHQSSESISKLDKIVKADEIESKTNEVKRVASMDCAFNHEYGKLFDSVAAINSSELEEKKLKMQEYCARKLVVDNKLLDTSFGEIVVNPDNLIVEFVRCDRVLLNLTAKFLNLLKITLNNNLLLASNQVKCFREELNNEQFLSKYLVIGVLNELNISDEQKATEKEKFISFMTEASKKFVDCGLLK